MVTVGRILRPHGNRGQVVVYAETDFPEERFRAGATLFAGREALAGPLTVTASREHDARWIVGFDGVESIDAAEARRGEELRVPAETLHPLPDGAFYVHDLVGCAVVTTSGDAIGRVVKVDGSGGVPILVVREPGREDEVLVPLVDAICRRVHVAGKTIEIDPPRGLLDLNRKKA